MTTTMIMHKTNEVIKPPAIACESCDELRAKVRRLEREAVLHELRIADLEGAFEDQVGHKPDPPPPTECQYITGRSFDSWAGPGEISVCGQPIAIRAGEAPLCDSHQGTRAEREEGYDDEY